MNWTQDIDDKERRTWEAPSPYCTERDGSGFLCFRIVELRTGQYQLIHDAELMLPKHKQMRFDTLPEASYCCALDYIEIIENIREAEKREMPEPEIPSDPWAHRALTMRCKTCMWFKPKTGAVLPIGRCCRRAPTLNGYPAVFQTDWCGDHKIDENRG